MSSESEEELSQSPEQDLLEACMCNDIGIVKSILSSGAVDVNHCLDEGNGNEYLWWTPLHYAVSKNSEELIEYILSKGANINALSKHLNVTPLHVACEQGSTDAARVLLKHNADLTLCNSNGMTAFYLAFYERHTELVNVILEHGCQLTGQKNQYLKKYFQLCNVIINGGNIREVQNLLQDSSDIDFDYIKSESPLCFAVSLNRFDIVKYLLELGANVNQRKGVFRRSVLHIAVEKDLIDVVELLLENNADIECITSECINGHSLTPLIAALVYDRPAIMKMLLEYGANVNRMTGSSGMHVGRTAFHLAAEFFDLLSAGLFLQYHADINRKDNSKNTALHIAINFDAFAEFLLISGADPNSVNGYGQTPLHRACEWFEMTDSLELLLKYRASTDARDKKGQTPMHYASKNQETSEPLEFLLDHELIHINARDNKGNTPINHRDVNCKNFLTLLEHGADINIENYEYEYPMFPQCYDHQGKHDGLIMEHFKKLKLLKYFVNEVSLSTLENRYLYDCEDEAMARYRRELATMERKIISANPRKSLLDVLFMKVHQLSKYAENRILMNFFEKGKAFEKRYPDYGYLMKLQYRKGKERRRLINGAKRTLQIALGRDIVIPDMCSDKIFKYLSGYELKKLGQNNA